MKHFGWILLFATLGCGGADKKPDGDERTVAAARVLDPATAVDRWLMTSCATEGDTTLRDALIRFSNTGVDVESPMLRAFEQGPPRDKLTALKRYTDVQFRQRRSFVKASGAAGVPEAEIRAMLAVTPEQHWRRVRGKYERGYRSRAASGLVFVGKARARASLAAAAGDVDSPVRDDAVLALQLLKAR